MVAGKENVLRCQPDGCGVSNTPLSGDIGFAEFAASEHLNTLLEGVGLGHSGQVFQTTHACSLGVVVSEIVSMTLKHFISNNRILLCSHATPIYPQSSL